ILFLSAHLRSVCVGQSHGFANVLQGSCRIFPRMLRTPHNNLTYSALVLLVLLRTSLHWLKLGNDGFRYRLFAFQTSDTCTTATLLHPGFSGFIRIHFMHLPDRATIGITRIGSSY